MSGDPQGGPHGAHELVAAFVAHLDRLAGSDLPAEMIVRRLGWTTSEWRTAVDELGVTRMMAVSQSMVGAADPSRVLSVRMLADGHAEFTVGVHGATPYTITMSNATLDKWRPSWRKEAPDA